LKKNRRQTRRGFSEDILKYSTTHTASLTATVTHNACPIVTCMVHSIIRLLSHTIESNFRL
jgi:hypothetical protein